MLSLISLCHQDMLVSCNLLGSELLLLKYTKTLVIWSDMMWYLIVKGRVRWESGGGGEGEVGGDV